MNTPVVNAPPMGMKAIRWGKNVADETAEKFISSLEMFVWCERICRNSPFHEGLVWGELMFWFPANPESFRRA